MTPGVGKSEERESVCVSSMTSPGDPRRHLLTPWNPIVSVTCVEGNRAQGPVPAVAQWAPVCLSGHTGGAAPATPVVLYVLAPARCVDKAPLS